MNGRGLQVKFIRGLHVITPSPPFWKGDTALIASCDSKGVNISGSVTVPEVENLRVLGYLLQDW
jgi:hypothetical protein